MIRLKRLELLNYKIHRHNVFEFENFTEIKKPNEFGKSTIIEAISDAFALTPEKLVGKKTKGSVENPVILLDFVLDGKQYRVSVNAQSKSITLKGEGVYLDTKESISKFFKSQGYPFLSYVVRDLLILRERDLYVDTRSRDFRKFTEDIFKVENINALKSVIDKILKEKGGFRDTSFGREYVEVKREYLELKEEIGALYEEYLKKLAKRKELNVKSRKLTELEEEIKIARDRIEDLKILGNLAKKGMLEMQLKSLKNRQKEIEKRLVEIAAGLEKYRKKEKEIGSRIEKKKEALEKVRQAEEKVLELERLLKETENKQKKLRHTRTKISLLNKEIDRLNSQIKKLDSEIGALVENKIRLQQEINKIKKSHVEFPESILAEFEKRYKDVVASIREVESIENRLAVLREKIAPYESYSLEELKRAYENWKTYNRLRHNAKGMLKVERGEAEFNGIKLGEGKTIEFEGKLEINHKEFSAVVYTVFELSELERHLLSYFKVFKSPEKLSEVIKTYKEIGEKEEKLQFIGPMKLLKEKKELEEKINRAKEEIKKSRHEKEQIEKLEKKLREIEDELKKYESQLVESRTSLEVKVTERDMLVKWLNEIDEVALEARIVEYKREIEELKDLLKNKKTLIKECKTLEEDLQRIKESISHLLKEEGARALERREIEGKIEEHEKEINGLKEYEKLLDGIPFGLVRDYMNKSYEEIQNEIEYLNKKLEDMIQKKIALSEEVARLKGYLESTSFLGNLDEKRSRLLELERKMDAFERMERFLRKVKRVLWQLGERIEREYIVEIEKRTREIFSRITENRYKWTGFNSGSIFTDGFGKNWSVESHDGINFEFKDLSDGTKTQLLFSIRLALISLFLGNKKAFLLLDEPFAYYDKNREKIGREILRKLYEDGWQIILMSARA